MRFCLPLGDEPVPDLHGERYVGLVISVYVPQLPTPQREFRAPEAMGASNDSVPPHDLDYNPFVRAADSHIL